MMAPSSFHSTQPKASTLVGLALVHSLLKHEDVQRHTAAKNAALDLLAMLGAEAPAEKVLLQFYRLRRHAERLAYLPMFKIRRWLEREVQVAVDGQTIGQVRLGYASFVVMLRRYQWDAWEFSEESLPANQLYVRFSWLDASV